MEGGKQEQAMVLSPSSLNPIDQVKIKFKDLETGFRSWLVKQSMPVEAAATAAVQGAAIGGLMGTLTSDAHHSFLNLPPNAPAFLPNAMASLKQAQAFTGSPLVQARNFAVMTGVDAGLSCVMKRIRGVEDVESSLDNSSEAHEEEKVEVTDEDLKVMLAYIDEKDGGPPWHLMMDRSTSTLLFRAWRRDPKYGPTQYRSQTIFENMEPELLRDFFWDDEFRSKWDDMLVYFKTLQEYPYTGTVITHWIRKFPFFCSHREYIIGRRMWVSGSTYYSVSKSIPFPDIPRRQRPRRVDLYYSSWCIREVESRNGGTACEVLLFHYEDMGIQKMLAKAGVQRGMWKLVQKLEQGVHAYQVSRQNGAPSRYALLARIATLVSDTDILRDETCLSEYQFKEEEEEDKICGFALAGGILMSWGLKHEELNKGPFSHIIQHIRNIHSSKEYRKVCFVTENVEIAKQSQELTSASKPLEELIQKAKSTASRQLEVLREQTPVSELLAWTERVSRPHSRWRASWPHLFMAAMKIFGW